MWVPALLCFWVAGFVSPSCLCRMTHSKLGSMVFHTCVHQRECSVTQRRLENRQAREWLHNICCSGNLPLWKVWLFCETPQSAAGYTPQKTIRAETWHQRSDCFCGVCCAFCVTGRQSSWNISHSQSYSITKMLGCWGTSVDVTGCWCRPFSKKTINGLTFLVSVACSQSELLPLADPISYKKWDLASVRQVQTRPWRTTCWCLFVYAVVFWACHCMNVNA